MKKIISVLCFLLLLLPYVLVFFSEKIPFFDEGIRVLSLVFAVCTFIKCVRAVVKAVRQKAYYYEMALSICMFVYALSFSCKFFIEDIYGDCMSAVNGVNVLSNIALLIIITVGWVNDE